MNSIENAVEEFNSGNYNLAEKIAIEILQADNSSNEAVDVLAAIYLRTEHLNFLENNDKKNLFLIRKIAVFLAELKTYPQAIYFYKKALSLDPNDHIAFNNLGIIYEEIEDISEAKISYETSLKIKNNYSATYNLGVLYRKLKDFKKSEKYLTKAIELNPENKYANYSLGMTYLINENFEKGYPYFLKRPIVGKENFKNFWDGQKHLDSTLLVFCEYGLGDAIMFARYLPFLQSYFKDIVVCCQRQLIELFKNSFPDIKFVTTIENLEYDYSAFMMNLPYHLKMNFNNIPSPNGYLKADENKIKYYKEKYFDNNLLKVGIFYIGGELEKRNAKYRAIELNNLSKLFTIKNCEFYSFQKEDPFHELNNFPNIINLGATFNDFTDTAAAMKNLDVMVTIDSAPVHLAGAIGINTLLMLPYYSEWRWFINEEQTPWYNSVKLNRQTTPCEWQSVVDKTYDILTTLEAEQF